MKIQNYQDKQNKNQIENKTEFEFSGLWKLMRKQQRHPFSSEQLEYLPGSRSWTSSAHSSGTSSARFPSSFGAAPSHSSCISWGGQQGRRRRSSGSSEGENCGGRTAHRVCASCSSSFRNFLFLCPFRWLQRETLDFRGVAGNFSRTKIQWVILSSSSTRLGFHFECWASNGLEMEAQ